MVWGFSAPSSFGDFFPDGDYVGWEEAVARYFNEEMSAEQRAEFDNWDANYRREIARKFQEDRGPLLPHERPSAFRLAETRKTLGSLIVLVDGLFAVDEALKNIVETVEPEAHEFWPIHISMPRGRDYPGSYYGMVIGRFIDSFVLDESAVHQVMEGTDFYYGNSPTKKGYSNLTLSKSVFSGNHLWRERRLRMPDVFISDELQSEIIRQGLRIPKHHEMRAI